MTERIEGHATPDGTRRFAARHSGIGAAAFTPLGSTDLTVGRLGFGCYRVDDSTPDHHEAIELALASGCNLIDTSTNYTDGASERLVGTVLRETARREHPARDEIVIVSKIGYVQGQNLQAAMDREHTGSPFPEMVRYMDGCWHCIHPEFLADQLDRSLERLGLQTLDVCLLHNPEYFLSDAKRRGDGSVEERRARFYRRLRDAFAFLEEAVGRGTIRCYGVSSNTAVVPPGDPEATSVERMLQAAREGAGKNHHFRVLQIPMNLFESGGAVTPNTGPDGTLTPLQAAADAGLGVLLNRPFNALAGGRMIRLAEPDLPAAVVPIEGVTRRLRALEREYADELASNVGGREAADASAQLFALAGQIVSAGEEIQDYMHWRQIEEQYVLPRVHYVAGLLQQHLDPSSQAAWESWWKRYTEGMNDLMAAAGRRAADRGGEALRRIAASIDPGLPAGQRGEPLSRKALWTLISTPGVSTVLVGMRRPAYVRSVLPVLGWVPLADPIRIYELLHSKT